MSRHNYSQYSNKNKYNDSEVATTLPIIDVTDQTEFKMEVDTITTATTPETVTGVITGCAKLNVREHPNTNSDIVCVLERATEIEINVTESTDEWFRVRTADGINGYCMRKFIDARL